MLYKRVFVIQEPHAPENFDMRALNADQIEYMVDKRFYAESTLEHMRAVDHFLGCIESAGPEDAFVNFGGSPLAMIIFGLALARSGVPEITFLSYSRKRDGDGRKTDEGRYRAVKVVPFSSSQIELFTNRKNMDDLFGKDKANV